MNFPLNNKFLKKIIGSKEERKRKGNSPVPSDKPQSAKKRSPDEKKQVGFERGLEPEKILGK